MTRWTGRLGAALLATIALTLIVWVASAIFVWLDNTVPWEIVAIVAVGIFVIAVVGDVVYDALLNQPTPEQTRERARLEALTRADDEL